MPRSMSILNDHRERRISLPPKTGTSRSCFESRPAHPVIDVTYMLTIYTTAKPFHGHTGVIQRNALQSWKALDPGIEVILFGDDPGAAETCRELGLRHEPFMERNEFGTKRLDFMFARAQEIARHPLLCYINCDIILLPEFCRALERVQAVHNAFLMVGRRWDVDVPQPADFQEPGAADGLRQLALRSGVRRGPDAVDYFAFRRGFYL